MLLERYVGAAERISALAVGDTEVAPGSDTFALRQDYSQDQHVEGQPFGTVGGMVVTLYVSTRRRIRSSRRSMRTNVDQTRGLEDPHEVEFTIDGERVCITAIGGDAAGDTSTDNASTRPKLSRSDQSTAQLKVRVPVTAGPRTGRRGLRAAVARAEHAEDCSLPQLVRLVRCDRAAAHRTLSDHRTVQSRRPGRHAEPPPDFRLPSDQRRRRVGVCATRIISTWHAARIVSRRREADMHRLLEFYQAGRRDGTFDAGIQRALQRILASPKFVFRVEARSARCALRDRLPDRATTSWRRACRSSSGAAFPTTSCSTLAARGRLHDAGRARAAGAPHAGGPAAPSAGEQFRRPVAAAAESAATRSRTNDLFPEFDDNLRQAFRARDRAVLREHHARGPQRARSADRRLHVRQRTPGQALQDSECLRQPVPARAVTDEARKGLLGQGSILTVTSNRQPHVARRPRQVDARQPARHAAAAAAGQRAAAQRKQRAARSRSRCASRWRSTGQNPVCASCHKLMDPLGFALENFDAVGAWRTRRQRAAPSMRRVVFIDGTRLDGVVSLRQALLDRPNIFVGTMTEKLLTYATGARVGDRRYARRAANCPGRRPSDDYRFASVIRLS